MNRSRWLAMAMALLTLGTGTAAAECACQCDEHQGRGEQWRLSNTVTAVQPPDACNELRAKAYGAFVCCVEQVAGDFYRSQNPTPPLELAFLECRKHYFRKWDHRHCDNPSIKDACRVDARFVPTDPDPGTQKPQTVTDNLTGLIWETKDDSGGVHDKDEFKTWSTGCTMSSDACRESGTAYTEFLRTLNSGASSAVPGFAGSSGWRLPNMAELQTIMNDAGLGTAPGFDLGGSNPTEKQGYWTSTGYPAPAPLSPGAQSTNAWNVQFFGASFGTVNVDGKNGGRHVRAVRGGL